MPVRTNKFFEKFVAAYADNPRAALIYSVWAGYLNSDHKVQELIKPFKDRDKISFIHSSGHAVLGDIKKLIEWTGAQRVLPIHTEYPEGLEGIPAELVRLHSIQNVACEMGLTALPAYTSPQLTSNTKDCHIRRMLPEEAGGRMPILEFNGNNLGWQEAGPGINQMESVAMKRTGKLHIASSMGWFAATISLLVGFCLAAAATVQAGALIGSEIISAESDLVSIHLVIPTIRGTDDWLLEEWLNAAWRWEHLRFAREIYEAAAVTAAEMAAVDPETDVPPFLPYQCWTEFIVKLNDGRFLSLVTTFYSYTGGAHGFTIQKAINYDLKDKKFLTLDNVVKHPEAVQIILDEVNCQIGQDPEWFFQDQLPVDYLNEEDFYPTAEGLVVFYQLYGIAPYAAGIQEFVIPWQLFE
jgi:hypothetical protein